MQSPAIPFIDLQTQRRRLSARIQAAFARVHEHGRYILGPEVAQLERQLAKCSEAAHVVTCANGTDALELALAALGLRPGSAVVVPAFTFCATAEAVVRAGGVPVLADVDSATFHLTAGAVERALKAAEHAALTVAGVIAVDLFGQPADYPHLLEMAARAHAWLLADAAQSFGARLRGRPVGALAAVSTTSFYPAKPLGCYGDGGAVFLQDREVAETVRSLRVHGEDADRYDSVRIGRNSRLDTLQAAVLLEKLAILPEELQRRQQIADRYAQGLGECVRVPVLGPERTSTWAQYTVVLERGDRDAVRAALADRGIPTAVYYPRPLHRQTAYRAFPIPEHGLPVSEYLAERVLSLPMHPYLEPEIQDRIIEALREAVAATS